MKQVINYLVQMFKFSPIKILGMLVGDFIYSIIIILTPMLICKSIDNLINNEIRWFILLLLALFVELVLGFFFRRYDTKVYVVITKHFKEKYYSEAISKNIDISDIDANVELVDDFSEFLQLFVINSSAILSILYSLFYLYNETERFVFLLTTVIVVIVLVIRFFFCIKKQKQNNQIKDENEKRRDVIGSREIFAYRSYLNRLKELKICYSNKEVFSYLLTSTLQLGLLSHSVYYVISNEIAAFGVIFATITYLIELNENSILLPEIYEQYLNLKDNIVRIYI